MFDWIDNAPGSLRWRDVDKDKGSILMGEGDGVLTLYSDLPTIPDAVQDSAGAWYVVESGLERDSLGAGLRLAIRRWKDPALPRIRAGAP